MPRDLGPKIIESSTPPKEWEWKSLNTRIQRCVDDIKQKTGLPCSTRQGLGCLIVNINGREFYGYTSFYTWAEGYIAGFSDGFSDAALKSEAK